MNVLETKTIEKIRSQYQASETTKMDELKTLDKKVKLPAEIFAYSFGIVGSLVLGVGMCSALKTIALAAPFGIAIGVVGIAMVAANYFIYKAILRKRKNKYSEEIIKLSNELLNE
ncbi:MAG: dihydropteridine reductase [Clostridia bacterium]|nr:dihydropteridine reductase [Clostridia bacterium]